MGKSLKVSRVHP